MKKLLSLFWSALMLLGLLLPVSSAHADDYIYGVPLENIGTQVFELSGVNVPNKITLNSDQHRFELFGNYYTFTASQQPTKKIQVFSANGVDGIRDIYVNTTYTITSENNPNLKDKQFYLFYNRYGGISLATPNFAGNVSADQQDVMLEYFTEGQKVTRQIETVSPDQAPYRIETSNLGILDYSHPAVNAPSDYRLNFNNGTMTFSYWNSSDINTYKFKVVDIPTKEIRVQSEDSAKGIRTVQVNTLLIPTEIVTGREYEFGYDYYLFKNFDGSISFVTPNFAGNYASGDENVMLEYVPR